METRGQDRSGADGEPSSRIEGQITPMRFLGARILALLFLLRSGGQQVYRAELGLRQIEMRLLSALGTHGPLPSLKLAATVGIGKAQASHATSGMRTAGLIARAHQRAPFVLTGAGEEMFARMATIAQKREARVMTGLTPQDADFLRDMVAHLTHHFEDWLAEEQRLAVGMPSHADEAVAGMSADEARSAGIVPGLVTMSVLLQRCCYLMWRRAAGISPFNWIILSRVAQWQRLRFSRLVYLTGRDKGQVSRTLRQLIDGGLLVRHRPAGRREVEFAVTPEGRRIYEITLHQGAGRDAIIADLLGPDRKMRLERLLDAMIANVGGIDRQ